MKKISLIILFFWLILPCHAQTYCYKSLFKVDSKTDVREKTSGGIEYVTFTSGKARCYFSDEDGTTKHESEGYQTMYGMVMPNSDKYSGYNTYEYEKKENDMYIYKCTTTYYTYVVPNYYMGESGGYYPMRQTISYLYFSTDYSRMNKWDDPQTYFIKSNNRNIQAAQSGYSMGSSIVSSGSSSSYVYVFERTSAPKKNDTTPSRLY